MNREDEEEEPMPPPDDLYSALLSFFNESLDASEDPFRESVGVAGPSWFWLWCWLRIPVADPPPLGIRPLLFDPWTMTPGPEVLTPETGDPLEPMMGWFRWGWECEWTTSSSSEFPVSDPHPPWLLTSSSSFLSYQSLSYPVIQIGFDPSSAWILVLGTLARLNWGSLMTEVVAAFSCLSYRTLWFRHKHVTRTRRMVRKAVDPIRHPLIWSSQSKKSSFSTKG